jgi:hypothetical protein
MRALRLYAGPRALEHLRDRGLRPADVGVIPAAAGGPKGLILGPVDRLLFGQWLAQSQQNIHLVGASIGAWRMGTACLPDTVSSLERLEHDYIHQQVAAPQGQRRPSAQQISEQFALNLQTFYGGRIESLLQHPRWRLHIVAARGRRLLSSDGRWRTPLGYLGAFAANAVRRPALGEWLERVVFSGPDAQAGTVTELPFATHDLRTRQVPMGTHNFMQALQASCSIPFVLRPVQDIPGAPRGTYWDGGITDYHLHLHYLHRADSPIVLYPHFQQAVVPGWLDKAWKGRHRSSPALDHMLVIAPDPQWVRRCLPLGKLPDRSDFARYGQDLGARVKAWGDAVRAAAQLAEELGEWLAKPDLRRVEPL